MVAIIGFFGAIAAAWFKWYLDNRVEPRVVDEQPVSRSSTPITTHSGKVNMAAGTEMPLDGQGFAYGHQFTFAFTTLDNGRTVTFAADALARQLIALQLYAASSGDQIKHPIINATDRDYRPRLEWTVEPGNYVVAIVAHSDDGTLIDFDVSYRYEVN